MKNNAFQGNILYNSTISNFKIRKEPSEIVIWKKYISYLEYSSNDFSYWKHYF